MKRFFLVAVLLVVVVIAVLLSVARLPRLPKKGEMHFQPGDGGIWDDIQLLNPHGEDDDVDKDWERRHKPPKPDHGA